MKRKNMALSDLFSILGGFFVICMNLYMTYIILTSCKFSPFLVLVMVVSSFLFTCYGIFTLLETEGEIGITYLSMSVVALMINCMNLYFVYNPQRPLKGLRKWLVDQQLDFGRSIESIVGPITKSLPNCAE